MTKAAAALVGLLMFVASACGDEATVARSRAEQSTTSSSAEQLADDVEGVSFGIDRADPLCEAVRRPLEGAAHLTNATFERLTAGDLDGELSMSFGWNTDLDAFLSELDERKALRLTNLEVVIHPFTGDSTFYWTSSPRSTQSREEWLAEGTSHRRRVLERTADAIARDLRRESPEYTESDAANVQSALEVNAEGRVGVGRARLAGSTDDLLEFVVGTTEELEVFALGDGSSPAPLTPDPATRDQCNE